MVKCLATLWSIRKDHEGEVRLQLLIPSSEAEQVITIPEGKILRITIEEEDDN